MKERVEKWLRKGRPFEEGLSLYSEFCKNKVLLRQMRDHPKRYQRKLMIYLMKAAGLDFQPKRIDPPAKTILKKPLKFSKLNARKILGVEGNSKGTFEKLPPADNSLKTSNPVKYPPEVEKVKAEYARLYNLRAQLHQQMTEVPGDNAAKNVKKRKVLSESIAETSTRLEKLYTAKEKYFEDGSLPDIEALFGTPKNNAPEDELVKLGDDVEALKKRKRQLQSMNVKYRNRLEYQAETKQPRKNPLPDCPQRLDYEKSIKENNALIEKINYKLVELAH